VYKKSYWYQIWTQACEQSI